MRNNLLNAKIWKKNPSDTYVYQLDILNNSDLDYLPLAKTKIEFILIEKDKVHW